jgi:hypothetical protein
VWRRSRNGDSVEINTRSVMPPDREISKPDFTSQCGRRFLLRSPQEVSVESGAVHEQHHD